MRDLLLSSTSLVLQLKIKAFSETGINWHSWLPLPVFLCLTRLLELLLMGDRVEQETWVKQQNRFKIWQLAFTGGASVLLVFPLVPSDGSFINQFNQSTLLNNFLHEHNFYICMQKTQKYITAWPQLQAVLILHRTVSAWGLLWNPLTERLKTIKERNLQDF